jgi:flagellar hook-associated protein 1 FlgK
MADPTNQNNTDVTFSGSQMPLTISGGQIGGAISARDTAIGSRITALDNLANTVATAINGFQSAGYGSNGQTGVPFFTGTTAATLTVNPLLQQDPTYVAAASAPNQPNNNSVALQISQLQDNPPPGGTITLQAQYNSMISQLGVDGQTAQNNVQTNTLVLQQLTAQQSSVSGVSLNEEAANLIQYQNAYEASARVISMMSQTISDMITEMG